MRKLSIYFALFFNLSIIFYFWWSNSGPLLGQGLPEKLLALGRLSGLVAVCGVLVQFLIMGKTFWLEKTFGLDKLSRVHHLNGQITIIAILLHPVLITLAYSQLSSTGFTQQFLTFLTSYGDILKAFIAVLLFSLIVFLSIYIVRKRLKYEVWYFVHLFTYLAIFLAWGHQLKNGGDFLTNKFFTNYWYGLYIFVFGNVLIFRFLKPLYFFNKHKFFVEKVVPETPDTTSVYISGKDMENFKIKPGQFMIFRFLTKNLWWQAHPFSLSKYPDEKNIRITIKNVGDFTSQIPFLKKGAQVIIDGPFGMFTKDVSSKNNILFIAGGIGITPIRSLTQQMVSIKKNVVLLYANKTFEDIVFQKELEDLKSRFKFKVQYILSEEKMKHKFLSGRIGADLIQKIIQQNPGSWDIYLCGPVPMMDQLKKDLANLGVPTNQIHFEKFSL